MPAPDTKYPLRNASAYTLIEILVSLTIIGILFGFGYASFREFSRRQAVSGAAKILQGDLRLAQQQALSGQKPESGCQTLDGVRFRVSDPGFGGSYEIEPVCAGAAVSPPMKSISLPTDLGITSSLPFIQFNVLGNGNNIASGESAVITLTQNGTSYSEAVTVTSGGEIR